MLNGIFKGTTILNKALDASWARNEAISDNIANVDTPGYKRKQVEFEKYISDAIDNNGVTGTVTNENHIPIGKQDINNLNYKVTTDQSNTTMRLDGNNVDIDAEMGLMAKNGILYNALIQKITGEFNKLRMAIKEGR